MLETRNLLKIYRPKKGIPVKAIDGVSLKFPDKGMVFLLGKSGSGKSTLLNLLGGLDKYDGGEIVIKGVSSKKFKQQHFDSYRNTYVGFIFQEYNILEEFSVGANIALAIELQGRKATNEELNKILAEVDLAGYGSRRPNELSGGQKQRVAIARALVKNPKIIMADEPSGALDSVTGKQVFDTLKKLSKEKLVIVVSHDRDFATEYADRIIELADGKVISDTTYCEPEETETPVEETETKGIVFEGTKAKIPVDYRLTEEDRIAINEYLDKIQQGGELEFTESAAKIKNFVPTDQEKIKSEDNSPFKLIKSKLSLKHAFKIGSGGLKYKKFRLVMTVLLSCIAFTLFGLVDTFSAYDHIKTTANSVYDSGVKYASVSKSQNMGDYWSYGVRMSDEDIKTLSQSTGIEFSGVISEYASDYNFIMNVGSSGDTDSYFELYSERFSGIAEVDETSLQRFGYELVAGKLPDGNKNEIAISKYIVDTFIESGYFPVITDEYGQDVIDTTKETKIVNYSDMVGKTLYIQDTLYTISGIVDTKFDWSRYESLLEAEENSDAADMIIDYVLYNEFSYEVYYNYTGMMMVGKGFGERYLENKSKFVELYDAYISFENASYYCFANHFTTLSEIDKSKVVWVNGEKDSLGEKEIILSSDLFYTYDEFYGEINDIDSSINSIKNASFTMNYYNYYSYEDIYEDGYKIVGILDADAMEKYGVAVLPDSLFNKYCPDNNGIYNLALGAMPDNKGDVETLAEYCYTEHDGISYSLNNAVSFELDAVNELLDVLSGVFLWIGIFFAVFAAILLSNFIATSISYKKQEIGILRAIGSRGNDVFRIFFAEAFIIAMINFVLAAVGTGIFTALLNMLLRDNAGILVTILNFGFRQILLLFVISIAVAAVASFIPVKKIASKRPIDAIRNR